MAKNEKHETEQSETEQTNETSQVNETETGSTVGQQVANAQALSATEGVRARRGIAPKQLVPNQDWIMMNVVAGGKGTRATVGRIFGIATSVQHKTNEHQGQMIESIAVVGMFNAESYITGEVSQGSSCFFPMAYAEQIAALFASQKDIKAIEVDCDIGLEATGKTIPYEWVTTAYLEGEEMAVLKRMKNARVRPTSLLSAPDGTPKQLTGPAK